MAHQPDPELVRLHREHQQREFERYEAEERVRKAEEAARLAREEADRAREAAAQRLRDLERGR